MNIPIPQWLRRFGRPAAKSAPRKALALARVQRVHVGRPGDLIKMTDGATYKVGPRGNFIKVQ